MKPSWAPPGGCFLVSQSGWEFRRAEPVPFGSCDGHLASTQQQAGPGVGEPSANWSGVQDRSRTSRSQYSAEFMLQMMSAT